jgi:thiamine-monophosphate kinase
MENDLLRWFRETLPSHEQVLLGAGDDAAIIQLSDTANLVATTDMLMDGVDFRVGEHEAAQIGHKALAVNLSDLAAMAAKPVAALVSLCLPRSGGEWLAQALYAGMVPTAAKYGIAIAGGDTNSWNGPLVINVTALGEVLLGREWRRNGAQPGDLVLVTGSFGGSILGKHLTFSPRVHEALWLAEHLEVHAAIDVSDGLSLDLARLCEASNLGAALQLEAVPISDAAVTLGERDGVSPLNHALSDGEDFELILAVSSAEAARFLGNHPEWKERLTAIGQFVKEPGLWSLEGENRKPLQPRGWEHRLEP